MSHEVKVIEPLGFASNFGGKEEFALDVLVGLSEYPKYIPSKYMYDAKGSQLFEEITKLPEYYLTNSELDSLKKNKERIGDYVKDEPFNLIELGSGSGYKTKTLIASFLKRGFDFQYVPIDISKTAMEKQVADFETGFPSLNVYGLVTDYFTGIKWLNNLDGRKNLILFLGSSIGNFNHDQARVFLRNLWNSLNGGDLALIGFDLKKDIEMLLSAYNDPSGVTARFNLNLLTRINNELGGHFDIKKFRHFGTYDVFSGAMRSSLVSLETQRVFIDAIGRSFMFRPWEPIRTDCSYKYLESDIDAITLETGFVSRQHFYDSREYFVDSLWECSSKSDSAPPFGKQ